MSLAEKEFWEKYWENIKLPAEVDPDFSFDRCLSTALKEYFPNSGEVLEVGCAPGKWLTFAALKFGLLPSGIEYSEGGVRATKKNFEILKVQPGSLIAADFFSVSPDKQYDVVMSFGFIEHFDDVDDVVERHINWLKPGGVLILGVPNFTGLNKKIQAILDQEILDKHNLNIMNLPYFQHLGKRFGLHEIAIKHLGSFEPALFIPKFRIGWPHQFALRCLLFVIRLLRRLHITDKFNSPYFSSYILAVYKKQ